MRITRQTMSRVALILALAAAAHGQTPPATQPSGVANQSLEARVLEVRGDVQHAPTGTQDWKKCEPSAAYPAQTMIRTGVRSSIKLQFGQEEPYTVLVVEPVSRVELSEAWKNTQTKRVRIGVGYGKIRAGVAEGGLQSDFTVDSPVATLSKRGTWDFGMYYERGTDRFEVFLLERGLVEVLNQITSERRQVQPGQAVTQAMLRWTQEAQIRTSIPISDVLGQQDVTVAFNRLQNDGLGVLGPGGGQTVLVNLSNASAQNTFASMAQTAMTPTPLPTTPPLNTGPFVRPEGFFGTGRGEDLIPILINRDNALAQQGLARPGRYLIRRDALQGWLRTREPR